MFLQLPKAMSLGVPSRRLSRGDGAVRGLRHARPLLQRSGRPSVAELQPLPSCLPRLPWPGWPAPLAGSGHYGFSQRLLHLQLPLQRCCGSFPIETSPSRRVLLQRCRVQHAHGE